MATIREYIASMGAAGAVPEAELDELIGRCPWFAVARRIRLRQRGEAAPADGGREFAAPDRAAAAVPWWMRHG